MAPVCTCVYVDDEMYRDMAAGDVIQLLRGEPKKWWMGRNWTAAQQNTRHDAVEDGVNLRGEFPRNYVKLLPKAVAQTTYPQHAGVVILRPFSTMHD